MRATWPVALVLACTAALASGCYHYVPEGSAALHQGTPIRVHLRSPQSFELSSLTAHNINSVKAEMVREDNGQVVLSALWLDAATGEGFPGGSWTFRIRRDDIDRLEIRKLSRWRTGVLLVGGFVATYLGFDALRGSEGGGGTQGNGGVPR